MKPSLEVESIENGLSAVYQAVIDKLAFISD